MFSSCVSLLAFLFLRFLLAFSSCVFFLRFLLAFSSCAFAELSLSNNGVIMARSREYLFRICSTPCSNNGEVSRVFVSVSAVSVSALLNK
jgi:hypothetical protein